MTASHVEPGIDRRHGRRRACRRSRRSAGCPAMENMKIASASAILGLVCARPARSEMLSTMLALLAHQQDAGEGADIHDQVDRHVDDHAAHALRGAGGETDQRVADMADRAVGHQALDVLLIDRGEGAQHHRGDRDEDDDLLPLGDQRPNGSISTRTSRRHGRELGRGGEEAPSPASARPRRRRASTCGTARPRP